MSATIGFSADCARESWMRGGTSLLVIVAAYAIWTALVVCGRKIPRTDRPILRDLSAGRKLVHLFPHWAEPSRIWCVEWQSWIIPVRLLSLTLIYALINDLAFGSLLDRANSAAVVTGAAVTVVSAWSWWRISGTYREFLLNAAGPRPK